MKSSKLGSIGLAVCVAAFSAGARADFPYPPPQPQPRHPSPTNNDNSGLGVVLGAAALLGVAALISHRHHHKNEPPDDPWRLAEHDRGYRDGLYGGRYANYNQSKDYDAGYDAGQHERDMRLAYSQRRENDPGFTAPPRLMSICAREASRRWGLAPDAVTPTSSRRASTGAYEVRISAGWKNGLCSIDDDGVVRALSD